MQAVLLSLDLVFRGHSTLLHPQEVKDFRVQVIQSSAVDAKTFLNIDVLFSSTTATLLSNYVTKHSCSSFRVCLLIA